jgi:iron uptake system component EfeO
MYVSRSLAGMAPVATELDRDVARLRSLVQTVTFQPAELANGATTLLDEVGKTKVTGEEERYSHVDLVDLVANVTGSQDAYQLLAPAVRTLDPALAGRVAAQFAAVDRLLRSYATGSGPTDYRSYATVAGPARRAISQAVDALAAPLSQVAGVVVAP